MYPQYTSHVEYFRIPKLWRDASELYQLSVSFQGHTCSENTRPVIEFTAHLKQRRRIPVERMRECGEWWCIFPLLPYTVIFLKVCVTISAYLQYEAPSTRQECPASGCVPYCSIHPDSLNEFNLSSSVPCTACHEACLNFPIWNAWNTFARKLYQKWVLLGQVAIRVSQGHQVGCSWSWLVGSLTIHKRGLWIAIKYIKVPKL